MNNNINNFDEDVIMSSSDHVSNSNKPAADKKQLQIGGVDILSVAALAASVLGITFALFSGMLCGGGIISVGTALGSSASKGVAVVALLINMFSLLLSIGGLVLGVFAGNKNAMSGKKRGIVANAALICGIVGFSISILAFTCTGCSTCAACKGPSSSYSSSSSWF